MKNPFKRSALALLLVSALLLLGACNLLGKSGGMSAATMTLYVQGALDETYRGNASDEYLKLVDTTKGDSLDVYLDKLQTEADYFAYYFRIEYPSDEVNQEIITLYQQIYAKSKYTVSAANKIDDTTWGVKVEVQALDLFKLVDDNWDTHMAAFNAKYADVDVGGMTDDEYLAYDADWASTVLDVCWKLLPQMGYQEAKSIVVQVKLGADGYWTTNEDDMNSLDYMIITYP